MSAVQFDRCRLCVCLLACVVFHLKAHFIRQIPESTHPRQLFREFSESRQNRPQSGAGRWRPTTAATASSRFWDNLAQYSAIPLESQDRLDNYWVKRIIAGIRSSLRNLWLKSSERNEALKLNAVKMPNRNTGRLCRHYPCSRCGKLFIQNQVEVHHLNPVGKLSTFEDLPEFASRLFCSSDKLIILCKCCHKSEHGKNNWKIYWK